MKNTYFNNVLFSALLSVSMLPVASRAQSASPAFGTRGLYILPRDKTQPTDSDATIGNMHVEDAYLPQIAAAMNADTTAAHYHIIHLNESRPTDPKMAQWYDLIRTCNGKIQSSANVAMIYEGPLDQASFFKVGNKNVLVVGERMFADYERFLRVHMYEFLISQLLAQLESSQAPNLLYHPSENLEALHEVNSKLNTLAKAFGDQDLETRQIKDMKAYFKEAIDEQTRVLRVVSPLLKTPHNTSSSVNGSDSIPNKPQAKRMLARLITDLGKGAEQARSELLVADKKAYEATNDLQAASAVVQAVAADHINQIRAAKGEPPLNEDKALDLDKIINASYRKIGLGIAPSFQERIQWFDKNSTREGFFKDNANPKGR